jgi:precorrin-2 methylase
MKKILIIGIGAGDPDYVTMQAVNALNQADVFFMMDKGPSKAKLIELRKEICRRYIRGDGHRFVDATSPQWTRGTEDYFSTVDDLNRDKQALFERLISQELADGECGAFLVWGDPTLYDSAIRIIEDTYKRFADQDIDIYWGAYVGMPDEILVSGKLRDVVGEIERMRADARRANGWIMDSYLMRRGGGAKT